MQKISTLFSICFVALFFSSMVYTSQEFEVEIGHFNLSPDDLLLQVGDKVVFNNLVYMEGGHTIVVDDGVNKVVSPAMAMGEQWAHEFKYAGKFTYSIREHPAVQGQATVFTEDGMNVATSDLRKEMVSYSLGYDFGENVVKKLENLDFQLFLAGLQHAHNDGPPKLDEDDMAFIVEDYRLALANQARDKYQNLAKANLEESWDFLITNSQDPSVSQLPSGLQYRVIKSGSGLRPKMGDKVKVHHKGRFINGFEFDNTFSANAAEFVLTEDVLPGYLEALTMMHEGGRWEIFIPPYLAYGQKGQRNVGNDYASIGPHTTLIFEVELIEIKSLR